MRIWSSITASKITTPRTTCYNVIDSGLRLNQAPTVAAGPDQTIALPEDTVSLDGSGSDDGLPVGSSLGFAWTQVSGPAGVVFGDPGAEDTTASFAQSGTYVLRLTVSDTALEAWDEVTVTVLPPNQCRGAMGPESPRLGSGSRGSDTGDTVWQAAP